MERGSSWFSSETSWRLRCSRSRKRWETHPCVKQLIMNPVESSPRDESFTLKVPVLRVLLFTGLAGEAERRLQPPSAAGEQGLRHRAHRIPLQEKWGVSDLSGASAPLTRTCRKHGSLWTDVSHSQPEEGVAEEEVLSEERFPHDLPRHGKTAEPPNRRLHLGLFPPWFHLSHLPPCSLSRSPTDLQPNSTYSPARWRGIRMRRRASTCSHVSCGRVPPMSYCLTVWFI